jgi:hydroxyethylthiazole kinase-like uncharacterized protein yjeF
MQKIINGSDVKQLDEVYIRGSGISSFDLMERAAEAFCDWYIRHYDNGLSIAVFCGIGNNGGDGLAISRLLSGRGYSVEVYYMGDLERSSEDFRLNYDLLPDEVPIAELHVQYVEGLQADVIIDAVFGVGINRLLGGDYLALIKWLNDVEAIKIAVDLPSGLPSDDILDGEAFKAHYTISFQFPKISLLFPDHAGYAGELVVLDIGIREPYFDRFHSQKFFIQQDDLLPRHKIFDRFSHKGSFGKVMLIGGRYGKMGSIRLSAQAALRTGSGLVSCFVPTSGVDILQISLPELMVESSESYFTLSKSGLHDLDRFDALGVGPGMGTSTEAKSCLEMILLNFQKPLVLDADAINILAANSHFLSLLGENVILTPHVKEFERLVGSCPNHKVRIGKATEFCRTYNCYLVLKGANSLVATPSGSQIFNSSGNEFMATAGAGDVLTGILTSFLGQGYSLENAAICGVYHHGLAGELASADKGRGTIATDIIERIPETFKVVAKRII